MHEKIVVLYQAATLFVNLDKDSLDGETTLWLGIPDMKLLPDQKVYLHCRQCQIQNVLVNSIPVTFEHKDPLQSLKYSPKSPSYAGDELDVNYRAALEISRQGELAIHISDLDTAGSPLPTLPKGTPSEVTQQRRRIEHVWSDIDGKAGTIMQITVTYNLIPRGGWRQSSQAALIGSARGMSAPLCDIDGVRCWLPCVDSVYHRTTYDITVYYPRPYRILCSGVSVPISASGSLDVARYVTPRNIPACAVGVTLLRIAESYRMSLGPGLECNIWITASFRDLTTSCSVDATVQDLYASVPKAKSAETSRKYQPNVAHTFLGFDQAAKQLQSLINRRYYSDRYYFIFSDSIDVSEICYFDSYSILPTSYLHRPECSHLELPIHIRLSNAFLYSWLGAVMPLTSRDAEFIIHGTIGYLLNTYVDTVCGEDDAMYRFSKIYETVVAFEKMGLSFSLVPTFPEQYVNATPYYSAYMIAKSTVLFYLIENRISSSQSATVSFSTATGRDILLRSLRQIIPTPSYTAHTGHAVERLEHAASAMPPPTVPTWAPPTPRLGMNSPSTTPGRMTPNHPSSVSYSPRNSPRHESPRRGRSFSGDMLPPTTPNLQRHTSVESTQSSRAAPEDVFITPLRLFTIIKETFGSPIIDLGEAFLEKWVYNAGALFLRAGVYIDKKTRKVELVMEQVGHRTVSKEKEKISINVVEAEAWHYSKRLENGQQVISLGLHSKAKKTGSKKKLLLQQTNANAPVLGGAAAVQAIALPYVHAMVPPPLVQFVSIDANLHWIREIYITMTEPLLVEQLYSDMTIMGQISALRGLGRKTVNDVVNPSESAAVIRVAAMRDCLFAASNELNLVHSQYIRAEAAYNLAAYQNAFAPKIASDAAGAWRAMDVLLAFLDLKYIEKETGLPTPNNIGNFEETYLREAGLLALSQIKSRSGETPIKVVELLLLFAENNDNNVVGGSDENPENYDDAHYVCCMLLALSRVQFRQAAGNKVDYLHRIRKVALQFIGRDKILSAWGATAAENGIVEYIYGNVTAVALQCICNAEKQLGKAANTNDKVNFMLYTSREAGLNSVAVRSSAVDCIVQLAFANYVAQRMRHGKVTAEAENRLAACVDWVLQLIDSTEQRCVRISATLSLLTALHSHSTSRIILQVLSAEEPLSCFDWLDCSGLSYHQPDLNIHETGRIRRQALGESDSEVIRNVLRKLWDMICNKLFFDQQIRSLLLCVWLTMMHDSAAGVPRSLQHISSLPLEDAQNQSLTLTAFPDPFFLSTLTPSSILRDDPLHAYKRLQQDLTLGCKSCQFYNAPLSFTTPMNMEPLVEEPQISRQISLETDGAEELSPRLEKKRSRTDGADEEVTVMAPRPKKLKLIL